MHTDLAAPGPLYAVTLQPNAAPDMRLSRSIQSAAAEALLQELRRASRAEDGTSSKAHSRAFAAAAFAAEGRVGIDVEFRAPGRRILEIGQFLLGEPVADEAAGYRLFTFREAYFKAFGAFPAADLLRWAAAESREARGDFAVLFENPAPGLILSLVWTGGGAPRRLR